MKALTTIEIDVEKKQMKIFKKSSIDSAVIDLGFGKNSKILTRVLPKDDVIQLVKKLLEGI
jgi:hypothetical protein